MTPDTPLLFTIERFLRQSGMAPTLFGRRAVNDPCFVRELRNGRVPGTAVRCCVEHFMNKMRAEAAREAA